MTTYNVHIYREMRLVFGGIEADSHEAAASIARDKPTDQADSIDDCDGENLAALVDVQGDEEYEQSRIIDFEPEQQRIAARKLLDALKTSEGFVHWALDHGAEREAAAAALEFIRTVITEAEATGMPAEPATPGLVPTLELQAALSWLLDDLTDAEEDRNPETGDEYDSVAFARMALNEAKTSGIRPEPSSATTVTTEMYDTLRYVAEMLSGFKPDFLRNIGLDVALEKTEVALHAAETSKA